MNTLTQNRSGDRMKLDNDNLITRVNENGELVQEPSYIEYLRNNGYTIEAIQETRIIQSESDREKAYMVVKIETYLYPSDHEKLDVAQHRTELVVCSCWAWRSNSNDVAEGEKPGGSCKHCDSAFKVERAKNDNQQRELGQ
jgi:hypothetical protein